MYLIVTGSVLLGTVCGAMIRLLPFVLILVATAAIAAAGAAMQARSWFDLVITALALQVGYALGIVGRAIFRAWRQRRTNLRHRAAD